MRFKSILLFLIFAFFNINGGFSQAKRVSLAVLGFVNTGSSIDNSFNTMLTGSLSSFLLKIPELDIVPRENVKEILKNYDLLEKKKLDVEMALDIGIKLGVKQILVGDYNVDRKAKSIKVNIYVYDVITGELKLKRTYTGSIGPDFFDTVDKINEIVVSMFYSRNVKFGKLKLDIDSENEYDLYINNTFQKKVSRQEGFNEKVIAETPTYISIKKVGTQKEIYSNTVVVPKEETLVINYVPVGHITVKAEGYENGEVFLNEKLVGNLDGEGNFSLRNLRANIEYEIYLSKEGKKSEKKKFIIEEGRNYNLNFSKGKMFLSEEITAGEVQANLCPDGSFEITEEIKIVKPYDSKKIPMNLSGKWHIVKYDKGYIHPEILNGVAHVNIGINKGLKTETTGEYPWSISMVIFPIELKNNKFYRLTFDAKAKNPKEIYLRIGEAKIFGAERDSEQPILVPIRIDTEMKRYSYLFKPSFQKPNYRIEFYITGPNEYWFDNVWLEYLGGRIECFGKVEQ